MQSSTTTPTFDPLALDVDWLTIESHIMYKAFMIQSEIHSAQSAVSSTLEYGDGPPDYGDFFDTRHYHYAKIGLLAVDVINLLNKECDLPSKNSDAWYDDDRLNRIMCSTKAHEFYKNKMIEC